MKPKKTPIKDICKGCHLIKEQDGCIYRYKGLEHLCPCTECLVKPMCSDVCQERKFTTLTSSKLSKKEEITNKWTRL